MSSVKKSIQTIPIDQIKGIDAMFGRQVKLDVNHVPDKFKPIFEKTRRDSFRSLTLRAITESYEISEITEDHIKLRNGAILESDMLARAFRQSAELVIFVVSVSGYEALDDAEDNMVAKLFLDSWGTAIAECGSFHIKKSVKSELKAKGIYSSFSFSPGQHNVPMELQKVIFSLLTPEEIGLTLNDHYLMYPKKSVSGIFGIGPVEEKDGMRPCDFCRLRDTCGSAYAGDEEEI